ncbi:phage head-tail adapter protein [Oenococcus oeni]|uniref:DUF1056 family protein n=1 Tax=Oenococcus oeni TaxID=1247 RepID=UPI0008F87510|nr:DUF1056 family protein [Oenococcus oeni]OIL58310.1 phage head-tail adapter protein [Oenococcus oeni]
MIFKTIFNLIWRYFDVICYVLALIFINIGVFLLLGKVVWISTGLSVALFGWLAEAIADSKGGGK